MIRHSYFQGNSDAVSVSGQKYCQDTERTYRTIPNTYTEEERQMRYRQIQQKRQLDCYNSSRHNLQQEVVQPDSPQHQKPPIHHSYPSNSHHQHQQLLDNRASSILPQNYSQPESFVRSARYGNMPEDSRLLLSSKKNHSQVQQRVTDIREAPLGGRVSKTSIQQDVVRPDGRLPAGNWIRENDEIVWCPEESPPERFGSLDRRKYSAQCATYNTALHPSSSQDGPDRGQRYAAQQQNNSTNRDYVLGLAGASKYPSSSAVTSHHQNYNSQVNSGASTTSCKRISPPPRTLLRTQSLGSVESWQQASQAGQVVRGHEAHQQQLSQRRDDRGADCAGRRKEKEWYETSMDTAYSGRTPVSGSFEAEPHHREIPRQIVTPGSPLHASARSVAMPSSTAPPPPPPPPPPSPPSSGSKDIGQRAASCVEQSRLPQQQLRYSQNSGPVQQQRHPPSPKSLEIPAESKSSRRNFEDAMRADRSPDLCTIVQAGKYQPYREVTKPFEMSDFYKYSTKYRKRAEALTSQNPAQRGVQPASGSMNGEEDETAACRRRYDSASSGSCNPREDVQGCVPENPVQRKIYEPVQRMSCQPYVGGRRMTEENGGEWRATANSRASSEDSTVV